VNKPRLLLADDSVTIRKVIELTFADEGIDVTTVADGDAAMSTFVEVQPDIVLVDVGLPGTDGYHICEMIKSDESTAHIPVLLLVGSFEPFDHDAAERSGADGFLTKPFHSIRDLVNRVHELLGTHAQSPLDIGDADIPFSTTSNVSDTEDIEDLYEQSFAETVQIEDTDTIAFSSEALEETPDREQDVPANDAERVDDDHRPADQWLDDESIETVEPAGEAVDEDQEAEGSPEQEVVEAISQYEDAPAAVVDLEPIKEFDWSPAAIVTAADEREICAAAGFSAASVPEEPFIQLSSFRDDNITEEYPQLKTNDIPEISREDPASANPTGSPSQAEPQQHTLQPPAAPLDRDRESLLVKATADELVEIIVRRVIDRLSDKAIREVAQEAVPRIAEQLMREALAEERSKNS